ncbi:S66 peptidase family protein [Lederbergia lenta]|uniref:Peptidase U61 LD-carboxypeptidase A n=1 Tax=Lederbergia lenta TaxID=1467 RepID=A0A2X4ZFB1_LEDLE|nr:LD-carboxypeptidase [Lederbergia lenta]MCM3112205.1 LD-carboxypeptidase [Lederbergia lenta]MEC2323373.1 LD-carboxypeptidase [Lederbergia lenta]SQI63305.1 peptidase U61 LD-carboxypeptidase A [Lederbergia lenta]
MNLNHGKTLICGDVIGITAPAGPVDVEMLEEAILAVKELGFQVVIGLTCYENEGGYLAGPALLRAQELNWMFANPDITAILCLRGGYGTLQILHLLDYDLIARNPKKIVGYSDITALHIVLQQRSNLATIHGPMAASDLISADDFTKESLLNVLMERNGYNFVINPKEEPIGCLVPGYVEGILTGGNLSVLVSTLGTPYEIDTCGKILFLEDIGEEPYKIDRMLTQLLLAGKLSDSSGIVLGTWNKCYSNKQGYQVEDLFEKLIKPLNKPTIFNLRAGHCSPMVTLPMGFPTILDATNCKLWNRYNKQ